MMKKILYLATILLFIISIGGCNKKNEEVTATPTVTPLVAGINEISIDQMIEGSNVARTVYIRVPKNLNRDLSCYICFSWGFWFWKSVCKQYAVKPIDR